MSGETWMDRTTRTTELEVDLMRRMAVSEAKRGKDVSLNPRGLSISSLCWCSRRVTCEDEIEAYRSCGGCVVMLAHDGVLGEEAAPVVALVWNSRTTQRRCRSTLYLSRHHARESRLKSWTVHPFLLADVIRRKVDLKNWQVDARHVKRVWATDAKAVHILFDEGRPTHTESSNSVLEISHVRTFSPSSQTRASAKTSLERCTMVSCATFISSANETRKRLHTKQTRPCSRKAADTEIKNKMQKPRATAMTTTSEVKRSATRIDDVS